MKFPGFVLGYHGCDRKIAEAILAGEDHVKPSVNNYDWLGSGAYFWENNPGRALKWAQFLSKSIGPKNPKIKEPSVLGAIIDSGNCLDLTEDTSVELVRASYLSFSALLEASGIAAPVNEPGHHSDADFIKRHLDCAVINYLHQFREMNLEIPFDTVRSPFFEGKPLYPGAKIAARTHVQWCVRNPESTIVAYFRPKVAR